MSSKRSMPLPERAHRKDACHSRGNRRASKTVAFRPGGSRHSLENLLGALREFALVFDGQGVVRDLWSSGPKRINGRAALRPGQHLAQLIDKEALVWIRRAAKEARRTGHSQIAIYSVPLADEVRTYAMSVMPFAWGSGAREKLACLIARDATMVTLDRRAQLEKEALLAQAEELANVGSWEIDLETDTRRWSSHFFRMLGATPENAPQPGSRGLQVIHPDDLEAALRDRDRVVRKGVPLDNELRFVTAHRGTRVFHSRAIPLRDREGRIVRIRGMSQDVTERREAEDKLREREALLTHAEEIANLGSYLFDFATHKAMLSPNLRKILGLRNDEEWESDACWERVHREDRARVRESMARGVQGGKAFEFVMRFTPPGQSMRHLHVRGAPQAASAGSGAHLAGVVQDITEQQEAEEKLRERSAMLEYAEKVAKLGSWRYDYATDSFTLSPNMRRILGIGPDDSWSSELYWSRVHPTDRAQAQAIFERATRERKPFEFVARFAPMNGGMARLCTRGITFCDPSEKLTHRVGVVQDITDQVRAEEDLRRLTQQLLRTRDDDRRRIARELHESAGQSLAALKMALGRLRETLGEGAEAARALLASVVELADSAVREVRTVSYLMHPPMLDDAGLGPALRWYARGFTERSGIQVRVDVPPNLPRQSQEVETTIFRIVQEALTNVHRYSGSRTAQIGIACQNGDICAEVSDEGCGLPAPRRSWSAAEALGVGIAGMRERVKQLNGTFALESAPGQGTTVRVSLPTGAEAAENAEKVDGEPGDGTTSKGRARSHGA